MWNVRTLHSRKTAIFYSPQNHNKNKALIYRVMLLFCAAGLGAEHVRTVQDVDGSLGNGVRTGCAQHAFRNEGLQRVVRPLAEGKRVFSN